MSYNKIFAKLGSDMKKPDATTVITSERFKEIVWPLPVSDLLYVGRATHAKLKRYCSRPSVILRPPTSGFYSVFSAKTG